MEDIVIKQDGDWGFDVWQDGKHSSHLGYDEMLGLVSALTMPEKRPCLQWMRTENEWRQHYLNMQTITKQNDAEVE